MTVSILPIFRDCLIRYQQTSIKQTGHRPMAVIAHPLEEALILPGCTKKGYQYWQPISWPKQTVPLGAYASKFHPSIVELVSLCEFLEIRFRLPIAKSHPTLGFVYQRVFETFKNTEAFPPSKSFEEAAFFSVFHPEETIDFAFAQTCDDLPPLLLMIGARDGMTYVDPVDPSLLATPLYATLDRLMPKLQFVFDETQEKAR